jgi:type IV pilus assembly protein PilE
MRGVTLMELLVVIVILALLASIAVPSYRRYLLRSQRTEAMRALMRAQTAQEKFFLQYNMYSDDLTAAPPNGLGLMSTTDTGKYTLTLNRPTTTTFTFTATAREGQRADKDCEVFTINQAGTRAAARQGGGANTANCWR